MSKRSRRLLRAAAEGASSATSARGPWTGPDCLVCERRIKNVEDAALVGVEGTGHFDVVHRLVCIDAFGPGGVMRHESVVDFLDRIEGA